MTALETELTRVLESYANDVTTRPEIYQQVETLYRRRRRLRLAGSAGGAAVVLVVAIAAFAGLRTAPPPTASASPSPSVACSSGSQFCDTPVPPPFTSGHWKAPQNPLPEAGSTWPLATFQLPARGPDGAKISPIATIDATHVLVSTAPKLESTGALYSYDLTSGTLQAIVTQMPGNKPILTNRWAVSGHFVVWAIDGTGSSDVFKNGFDVYAAPLSGGTARLVAHVDQPSFDTSPWYATDTAVYWSDVSTPGVLALSLDGGAPTPVPGFADMRVVDASGWTVRATQLRHRVTTELKQLGTGRTLQVATSPNMFELSCTPTFCVGTYGQANAMPGEPFIQDLDGGHRMTLPKPFSRAIVSVQVNGDSGLVLGDPGGAENAIEVWDPLSGASGTLVATQDAQHGSTGSQKNDVSGFQNGKTGVWTYLALGAIR